MAIACTPQALQDLAGCFSCLLPGQQTPIQTYLLCQVLTTLDPMATCDIDALLEASNCFQCLTPGQHQLLQTYLLCQIQASTGAGGTAAWTLGEGPPAVDGSVLTLFYKDTLTGFHYTNLGTVAVPDWDII